MPEPAFQRTATRGAHERSAPLPAASPSRGAPASALALQRSAGNRAVARMVAPQRVLARSVITIHSPDDAPVSRRITRNCEQTLRTVKGGTVSEAARGQGISMIYNRPPTGGAPVFTRIPDKSFAAGDQTIYILGHGSAETSSVSGLNPLELAETLVAWFGDVPYTGKIKLVSCTTAADWDIDAGGSDITGLTPVAESLAYELGALCDTLPFKPRSVDGVLGICWVDEKTGRIVSTDLKEYMKDAGAAVGAYKIRAPAKRAPEIQKLFGHAMTVGKGGKKRWDVAYPSAGP